MVTLVLTEVARLAALALPITNGAKGITNIPLPGRDPPVRPDAACRTSRRSPTRGSPSTSSSVTLMVLVLRRRSTGWSIRGSGSSAGRCSRTRSSPPRSASTSPALRVIAYAISSFLGGIGGAMFVAISQSIYPSSFTVTDSINFMLNCFLGGLGYVFGPMVGTLRALFRLGSPVPDRRSIQLLIYSAVLIAAHAGPAQRPPQPRSRRAEGSRRDGGAPRRSST